jgi:hypothetical protein
VPDPDRSAKELINAGLLLDQGAAVVVAEIGHHVPPEGQRDENLLPRKRANQG